MLLEVLITDETGSHWAMRGSYPDGGKPEVQRHAYDAMERCAKSYTDGGYRVRIDGIEVGVVSASRMAAVQTQFEVVTTPRPARQYESAVLERAA